MEGVGRYKKMKVGVAKIKDHAALNKVDVRETNWELYNFKDKDRKIESKDVWHNKTK